MAYTSTYMGLRVWDLSNDPYDHNELANNWAAVDRHNHATGKGVQIPEGGIEDNAITTAKLLNAAVTTPKIADNNVTGVKITDGAIINAKIANLAVTGEKIADNSISSGKIQDGSITGAKIADGSITTAKIAPLAVTSDKIADNAVTAAKIATAAVGTDEIQDGSVTTEKLANGSIVTAKVADAAITLPKLDTNIVPVGTVIPWWRPNDLTPIPTGWIPADGRTLTADQHDFGGGGSVTLPDLRNRFVLGAGLSNTGTGTGTPPGIGTTGGNHLKSFRHSHSVNAHTHTVGSHTHSIGTDGSHRHNFLTWTYDSNGNKIGETETQGMQRTTAVATGESLSTRQAFYIPDLNRNAVGGTNVSAPMINNGSHNHGGATGWGGSATTSSNGSSTDEALTSDQDIRPRYIGLLYLIKVKNS